MESLRPGQSGPSRNLLKGHYKGIKDRALYSLCSHSKTSSSHIVSHSLLFQSVFGFCRIALVKFLLKMKVPIASAVAFVFSV